MGRGACNFCGLRPLPRCPFCKKQTLHRLKCGEDFCERGCNKTREIAKAAYLRLKRKAIQIFKKQGLANVLATALNKPIQRRAKW